MDNKSDFLVSETIIKDTVDSINLLIPLYEDSIKSIRTVTTSLLDKSNWKGEARDEFYDTYTIVERYLTDDSKRVSSISEILDSFLKIYKAIDVEGLKKIKDTYDKVKEQ